MAVLIDDAKLSCSEARENVTSSKVVVLLQKLLIPSGITPQIFPYRKLRDRIVDKCATDDVSLYFVN